jgi:hypothetical protein
MFYSKTKIYGQILKNAKRSFKLELAEKLELTSQNDPKLYWKALQSLKDIDNKNDETVSPITAEEWTSYFGKLFEPHSLTGHKSETDILNDLQALENQPTFNDLSFQITTEEVKSAISKLKAGKSPGTDLISSEIIKACSNSILSLLTKLFNLILVKGQYPKCWTEGIISTIHKKGSPSSPDNYRGITISSCMGKLFGIILNKRLTEYCNVHNIIDERQAGFRKNSLI